MALQVCQHFSLFLYRQMKEKYRARIAQFGAILHPSGILFRFKDH